MALHYENNKKCNITIFYSSFLMQRLISLFRGRNLHSFNRYTSSSYEFQPQTSHGWQKKRLLWYTERGFRTFRQFELIFLQNIDKTIFTLEQSKFHSKAHSGTQTEGQEGALIEFLSGISAESIWIEFRWIFINQWIPGTEGWISFS